MKAQRALEVRIAGTRAGELRSLEGGDLEFAYDALYAGPDLSAMMPFSRATYRGRAVRAWFSNLLPDDANVRRGMALDAGIAAGTFSLLSHYGLELPGAVQVIDPFGAPAEDAPRYFALSEEQIGARLRAMLEAEAELRPRTWALDGERWSLGGMQAKLALREFDGQWSECLGNAASNVVVKPGVGGFKSQALDECVTMRLAKLCGLPAADVGIHDFDGQDAIVVRRYDRITDSVAGAVMRIHQEDLCQATGTVPEKKYAMDGGPSAVDIMRLLEKAQGASSKRFVDALLFNYLTASTDAHAKNYSLLHLRRGEFLLAPLYDVASVAPYMQKGKVYRTAMAIGGENRVGWLRRSAIERFANAHELDVLALTERTCELAQLVMDNLEGAVNGFAGQPGIDELACRLVPRVRQICRAAQRNVRADAAHCRFVNPSRLQITSSGK